MKPNGPVFDHQWRMRCAVETATKRDVDPMIRAHYLGKWPAICTLILALTHQGKAVGTIVYSLSPRETSVRYGAQTWELARLWIDQSIPANAETFLISQSVKIIRKNHELVRCLVSYADPSFGHAGTIYKAANWICDGRTDEDRKTSKFDMISTSTDLFGATLIKKWGRHSHIPPGEVTSRLPRVSKFRFYYRIPEQKSSSKVRVSDHQQSGFFDASASPV